MPSSLGFLILNVVGCPNAMPSFLLLLCSSPFSFSGACAGAGAAAAAAAVVAAFA